MAVSAISISAGNNGSATVGQVYPQNIVVFARQADFSPAVGVVLTALLPSNPGGSFASGPPKIAIVTTDATGHATLPTIRADGAVGNWTGSVVVSGAATINTTFSMAAVSGVTLVPTALTLVSSAGASAVQGQAFGAQVVRLTDQFTNPMPGRTIAFSVPAATNGTYAGGAIATSAVTDSAGRATMPTLVAGSSVGAFNATASILALNATIPLAVANGAVPTSITVVSGSNQYTPPSTGFLQPLVALVRNALGTGLVGVPVTVTKPGAGASCVCGSNFVTDANGRISFTAVANATAGTYQVTASVAGVPDAVFVLTNASSSAVCTTAAYPTGFGTTPYMGGQPWTNTEQILFDSPDGAQTVLASGQISMLLRGSTFGADIPDGSTITGYILTYKAKSSVAGGDITPYLFVSGSALTGTPVAQSLTTSMTAYQRGTSTDTWGNTYTVDQVKGSAFSVAFIAHSPSGAKTVSISNVKLSICYKTPQGLTITPTAPAAMLMDN